MHPNNGSAAGTSRKRAFDVHADMSAANAGSPKKRIIEAKDIERMSEDAVKKASVLATERPAS